MIYGLSVREFYHGPPIDALQFHLDKTTLPLAPQLIRQARAFGAKSVSAHLPISEPAKNVLELARIGEGLGLDYMVAHVTIQTPFQNWVVLKPMRHKVFIENHNQEIMDPRTAGWCWPEQFQTMVDAGFKLNLDIGHAMLCCAFQSPEDWRDKADETFYKFLRMPIAAAHVHTISRGPNGYWNDHQIDGVDIKPWVSRLVEDYPNITLIGELPNRTDAERIAAMKAWIE